MTQAEVSIGNMAVQGTVKVTSRKYSSLVYSWVPDSLTGNMAVRRKGKACKFERQPFAL